MNDPAPIINEQAAAAAFSKQASLFDELYAGDGIHQSKWQLVAKPIRRRMKPLVKAICSAKDFGAFIKKRK